MNMSEINLNDMQSGHHRNPFTVPEGYFDHFADDFMARLDDQPAVFHHSWWHRYRYYVASAACLAGLLLTSTVYLAHTQHQQTKALAEQHAIDASIDEMADYAMYDKGDMYASLSEY